MQLLPAHLAGLEPLMLSAGLRKVKCSHRGAAAGENVDVGLILSPGTQQVLGCCLRCLLGVRWLQQGQVPAYRMHVPCFPAKP